MKKQNCSERFFAAVLKRILVSLSCVSVTLSSGTIAFAEDISNTSPEVTPDSVAAATATKKEVAEDTQSTSTANIVTEVTPDTTAATVDMTGSAASVGADATTPSGVAEVKAAETVITTPAEVKAAETVITSPAEVKAADTGITTPAEVKAAETVITTPAEVKAADTGITTPAEAKAEGTGVGEAEPSATAEAPASVETSSVFTAPEKLGTTRPTAAEQLASVPILGGVSTNQPIVIDNDEVVETEATIKYEELPTDEGKTRVKTGAKFPVVISSEITTKTAKKGDPVEARLKYDLKIGDRLIAKKGAVVHGHINYALPARSTLHSLVSPTRWYRNSGCVGLSFDEIINDKGEHLPLVAVPARAARIVKNKGEGRELGVNHDGQVTGPWSQQLRYKAIRIGLNAALAPAGAFSFGAMPVALGVMGAVNPSFAFMKPVGLNVRHRRIKGFVWGALSGVPGSWLIEDTVVKGQEAVIKPGDEFLAEFQQEFTGEPASEATMMPNAKSKVHGQVMPDEKKSK